MSEMHNQYNDANNADCLKEQILLQIQASGFPEPIRDVRFYPKRDWVFDFAWVDNAVAVVLNDEQSIGMTPEQYYEMMNTALLLGWGVFQFNKNMIESGKATEILAAAFGMELATVHGKGETE